MYNTTAPAGGAIENIYHLNLAKYGIKVPFIISLLHLCTQWFHVGPLSLEAGAS